MSLWRPILVFLAVFSSFSLNAQTQVATGQYQFGTYDALGADTINVGNLNVMLDIPVLHKAGRAGTNFTYDLFYNGAIWRPGGAWTPDQNWGWIGQTQALTGYLHETSNSGSCQSDGDGRQPFYTVFAVTYYDTAGIAHAFNGSIYDSDGECSGDHDDLSNTWSNDGQYFIGPGGYPIKNRQGAVISPPVGSLGGSGTYTDLNGNQITTDGAGHFTDTTGNLALTIAGSAPSNQTYTYTDASGSSRALTIAYHTYSVATSFGCSGTPEYTNSSVSLIDAITMPDGTSTYHFTYEPTPGVSGKVTGRLKSVQLPAGGTITYGYSGSNNGINCTDGSPLGITRTMSSASGSPSRTYTRTISGTNSHTSVVDAAGNHSEYDFISGASGTSGGGPIQTALSVTNGSSGTPLLSKQTCYNSATPPCNTQTLSSVITEIDQYNTRDGVAQNEVKTAYDLYGDATQVMTYDFGSTSPGSLLQTEQIAYSSGLITSDQLADGTGLTRKTSYYYDNTTSHATSGVPHHNAATGHHGNLTEIDQSDFSGSVLASHTLEYYDTGSLYSDHTLAGGVTYYNYDSTNTSVTSVAPADPNSVGLTTSYTYAPNLGVVASVTNPNGNVSSVVSTDAFGRPTEVDVKQSGTTLIGKSTASTTPTKYTSVVYQSSSVSTESDIFYDAYGRPIRSAVQNGAGWYVTDTCYDITGHVNFQSYPYSATTLGAQVCSGAGDTTTYDGLGRVLTITHADAGSTSVSYSYLGAATKKTDENGVAHILQTDGLGRLTINCELTSIAQQGVSPTSCGTSITGTGFVTSYAYSLYNTTVTQGSQTRSFTIDGLGRPAVKVEPETPGSSTPTRYTYTAGTGSTGQTVTRIKLKANQTSTSQWTNTTTQYDILGRPTSITYDDGITPTKTFTYDVAPTGSSFSTGYSKGLLTSVSTGSSGAITLFSYDAMGRISATQQCIPGWCSTPSRNITRSYTYDWQGNKTGEQYSTPSGIVSLTYGVNLAGQLLSIAGGQDATLSSLYTVPAASMSPFGPTAVAYGNGISATMTNDVLGHPTGLGLTQSGSPIYAWTANWSGQRIASSQDSVNGGSATYSYDDMNRLSGATIGSLNLSWAYDRYGNRWSQSASGSYPGGVTQPSFSIDPATNHITSAGYAYDTAGNLTADGVNTYTYDAEGNVITVSGGTAATFAYDALNQRVMTVINGTTRAYGFDADRRRATVWDGNGNFLEADYYAGSTPFAYFSQTQTPPAPNGYSYCAPESGSCSFDGNATVAYGANGQFYYQQISNGTSCGNSVFGDPDPGFIKACFYQSVSGTPAAPTGFIYCSDENGTCGFSGVATVAYGANSTFSYKQLSNGTGCSNVIFGDPDPNVAKACFYSFTSAGVHFRHKDWLGTARAQTSSTGSLEATFTSLPFGDSTTAASGADTNANHYAELDADTMDLQHANFREYSSVQGRWLRPDPSDGSYAMSDPQSFNRYAYVGNSPLSYTDATGLQRPPCSDDDDNCGLSVIPPGGGGSSGFMSAYSEFDLMNIPVVSLEYGWTPVALIGNAIQSCGVDCISRAVGITQVGWGYQQVGTGLDFVVAGTFSAPQMPNIVAPSSPNVAPSNSNNCSVLTTPCNNPSKFLKYVTFLGCEFNNDIEQLTDEEDAQAPVALTVLTTGVVGSLAGKLPGWTGITAAITGAVYVANIAANSNKECSPAYFSNP